MTHPADTGLLRTLATLNMLDMGHDCGDLPCAGVYAEIVKPGRIRRGDEVRLIDRGASVVGAFRGDAAQLGHQQLQ
jgi:hypothetical protein